MEFILEGKKLFKFKYCPQTTICIKNLIEEIMMHDEFKCRLSSKRRPNRRLNKIDFLRENIVLSAGNENINSCMMTIEKY